MPRDILMDDEYADKKVSEFAKLSNEPFKKPKIKNPANRKEYLELIKTFPKAAMPMVGRLYSFLYNFQRNPEFNSIPTDRKKFYDFYPYDLIIRLDLKRKLFYGVNFHNIPPKVRTLLFNKFKSAYSTQFNKKTVNLIPMNYLILMRFLKKLQIAIRCYRIDRVQNLREIPVTNIEEMNERYANFFFKTTSQWVFSRYNTFIPTFSNTTINAVKNIDLSTISSTNKRKDKQGNYKYKPITTNTKKIKSKTNNTNIPKSKKLTNAIKMVKSSNIKPIKPIKPKIAKAIKTMKSIR